MGNGTSAILIVLIVLIIVIFIFIRTAVRIRKYGGSSTTLFASTYEFYDKDKRKAIEQMVEIKANKKMEEESSDKPKEDD